MGLSLAHKLTFMQYLSSFDNSSSHLHTCLFLLQFSRDNLDPFHMNDDLKIWSVLEKCHVKEEVEAVGLDTFVKESGISFSVGQRQLICLARALLKSSKVKERYFYNFDDFYNFDVK